MNGIPFSPSEFSNWFVNAFGLSETAAEWLSRTIAIIILIAFASLINGLVKGIALKVIRSIVKHSGGKFGNALLEVRFFQRLSHLAPAILVKVGAPWLFAGSASLLGLAEVAVNVYLVVIGLFVFDALLNAGLVVYQHFDILD